ncbi:hypothetical protein [Streptomyces sp. NPDC018347]|uniref:hypothetical protein n=1 Tax=Streptomyces sp. NPDC018347 TaxID=3157193 RepID=UPI0034036A51
MRRVRGCDGDTGKDLLRVLQTTAAEERDMAAASAVAGFNLGGTRQRRTPRRSSR